MRKENNGDEVKLPRQIKITSEEEINEEAIEKTLRRGIRFYSTLQTQDGFWPGDYGGPLFLLPALVNFYFLYFLINWKIAKIYHPNVGA